MLIWRAPSWVVRTVLVGIGWETGRAWKDLVVAGDARPVVLSIEFVALIVMCVSSFRVYIKWLLQTLIRLVMPLQYALQLLLLHLLLVLNRLEHASTYATSHHIAVLGSSQIEKQTVAACVSDGLPMMFAPVTSLLSTPSNRVRNDQVERKFTWFDIFGWVVWAHDAEASLVHLLFVHLSWCDLRHATRRSILTWGGSLSARNPPQFGVSLAALVLLLLRMEMRTRQPRRIIYSAGTSWSVLFIGYRVGTGGSVVAERTETAWVILRGHRVQISTRPRMMTLLAVVKKMKKYDKNG